jgi:hypothetical protein
MVVLGGCQTAFMGSAFVEQGPAECQAVCQQWGMELAGMVKMGEYSDGCVCQVPGKSVSMASTAVAAGAASGVIAERNHRDEDEPFRVH